MIPIYRPYLPQSSLKYAHEAIDSTWISSQGKYISLATEKLQELLGVKYVLLVNNGTSACHLVSKCVSEKKDISKIIVPNNVYVAAWNAFLFDRNFELISVEADLNTWNYNLKELDKTIMTHPDAAVLIVHNIGNIINVPALQRKYPDTIFCEDNCEGLFGRHEGQWSGTTSYVSAVSFYGNKTVSCGEGGAFLTNDEEAYSFAKMTHAQGQSEKRFVHSILGYNFRMTNIQAALLYGQLTILPEIMEKKREVFERYRTALKDREDILIQDIADNTEHSNWMLGIRVPRDESYDDAELYFKDRGIEIRPMFYELSKHLHLNNSAVSIGDCENAKVLNRECFILPSYPDLTEEEQGYILKTLNEYVRGIE